MTLMTHRERAEIALLKAEVAIDPDECSWLWMELRQVYRKLRGGHNSAGRRPSVKQLRSRLLLAAERLRRRTKINPLCGLTPGGDRILYRSQKERSMSLSESVLRIASLPTKSVLSSWSEIESRIPNSDRKSQVQKQMIDLGEARTQQGFKRIISAGERKLADESLLRLSIWLEGYESTRSS